MKRIFTNLKAYASAAMAVALMGVAALGVSCTYDDTAIYDELEGVKGDLDGVKGDLAELEQRVAALETKVNNEVAGLQALIVTAKTEILDEVDGKFVTVNGSIEDLEEALAAKYAELAKKDGELAAQLTALEGTVGGLISAKQNSNGEWVLTLSTGQEITIYPQTKQSYHGVTVQQQNGTYYWAQYNADGTVTFLKDEEGNKYPLHHATPVVDVEGAVNGAVAGAMGNIKVEPNENGELQLTLDGGKTWYPLGGGGDAGLFTGVSQDYEAGTATFSLVGGEEITVALAKEAEPEMIFNIKSGKLYLKNEETVAVKVAAELVKDVTVLSAPKGWSVEFDGKNLLVTAPSYLDVVGLGTADEEGTVKVLATDGTGAAIVASLRVSASEMGLFLTVDAKTATFNIVNTLTYIEYGEEMPVMYFYGITAAEKFNPETMYESMQYGELNYEYGDASFEEPLSIEEMYGYLGAEWVQNPETGMWEQAPAVMVPGASYIVWAAPMAIGAGGPDMESLVYAEYKYASANLEVLSTSFNDIVVDLKVAGYDGYWLNMYTEEDNIYAQNNFEEWVGGGWYPFGQLMEDEGFNGSIFETLYSDSAAGTKYYIYVLPRDLNKEISEYTWADVLCIEAATTAITAGGEGAPTYVLDTEKTSYTSIVGTLTPAEGAVLTYYRYYTEEAIAEFEGDEAALVADLLDLSTYETYIIDAEDSVRVNNLNAGDTRVLVAVSVDADGQYGQIVKVTASTKTVQLSSIKTVIEDTETSADGLEFSAKISTTDGEAVKYRYELIDADYSYGRWVYNYKSDIAKAQAAMAVASDNDYYIKTVAASDLLNEHGWATFNASKHDTNYILLIAAIDADGNMGEVVSHYFSSDFSAEIVKKYLEDGTTINPVWEAAKPSVVIETLPEGSTTDVTITVTPGTGATKCWMGKLNYSSAQLPTAKVKNMLTNWANGGRETLAEAGVYGIGYFTTESDTVTYTMNKGYHIHILWQDADGKFYEPYCVEWGEVSVKCE